MSTIFSKIIRREIPAEIIYEDDLCLAFRDIRPRAPTHILLIPKKEIATLQDVTDADAALMGHLMTRIPVLAKMLGIDQAGYRLVINCKDGGGQEVFHLHLHLLGGRPMAWPPG